jgi:chromate reductase
MRPLTVMALSGSLRKASLNTALLTMAVECAPPDLRVALHRGLGDLPLFNPDLDGHAPTSVVRLHHQIASADAVLIASPEYAHGVSGVMKNALDWMVASGVFVGKPVVLWNASPRASHALAALRETLTVMSARLIDEAGLALLIKPPEVGSAPVNPDPAAMRRALLALRDCLLDERAGACSDGVKLAACAAP